MTIEYPKGLPLPLREGYGLQHVDPVQRTPLASGRTRDRERFKSVPSDVSVSWLLSPTEAMRFEGWHAHELNSGASWFDWPTLTPIGMSVYEAKFAQMYKGPDLVGVDHWRYTAVIRLKERPIIGKEWILYAPDFVLYGNVFDLAVNAEKPLAQSLSE